MPPDLAAAPDKAYILLRSEIGGRPAGESSVSEVGGGCPRFFCFSALRTREKGRMAGNAAPGTLALEIERRVEEMGFEVVELETAGNRARPILRLYVDRPDSVPGQPSVSLDDCTAISRALEPMLDERADLADTYVLEVSSPGVERPLTKPRDWRRFAGQEVALRGKQALAGKAKRLEGELLGLGEDDETVRLRLAGGEEVAVPLAQVERAHLVYRWERK